MHRFVLTARVPSVRGLCELLPPVIPFVREVLSEVEREGNTGIRAGLGHHPSVS